jgi:hypothetical protein
MISSNYKPITGLPMIPLASILLLCIQMMVFAQEYVESSGQTMPFDLKAGAKAAWDKTVSGVRTSPGIHSKTSAFRLTCLVDMEKLIFVATGNNPAQEASLSIYRLDGVLVDRASSSTANMFTFDKCLSNGYYWVRLESNGKSLALTRMLLAR